MPESTPESSSEIVPETSPPGLPSPAQMPPTVRILDSLRRIIRAVDVHSQKLKSDHGITAPQLVCLMTVLDHAPLTMSELSKRVHLSASTVVGIVDRLEQRGLVRRERGGRDRREVFVVPTDAGRELGRQAPSPLQDKLADALGRLTAAEQATIAASLDAIVDMMEVRNLPPTPL